MTDLAARGPLGLKTAKPTRKARAQHPLRAFSQGQDCTLRIPGVCRRDPAYTVGCHVRAFGVAGMGQKPHDLFMLEACDRCHFALDHRDRWAEAAIGWDDVLRALIESQTRRLKAGLITVEEEG